MKDQIEESKLTAYVLGELEESEAQEIREQIDSSPRLQAEVDEIKATVAFLRETFSEEPAPALSEDQKERILSSGVGMSWRGSWVRYAASAAAACLVLAVYLNWPVEQGPSQLTVPVANQRLEPPAIDYPESQSVLVPGGKDAGSGPQKELQDEVGLTPPVVETEVPQVSGEVGTVAAVLDRSKREDDRSTTGSPEPDDSSRQSLAEVKQDSVGILPALKKQVEGFVGGALKGKSNQPVALTAYDRSANRVDLPPQAPLPNFNTEAYDRIDENPFRRVSEQPLSTFSIDVDTASYANVRRFLNDRQLPPKDAVRIEELVNYFHYDYAAPTGREPFAAHIEMAPAPWEPRHRLVRFGLKGREIEMGRRPAGNFVFLLDVSGSMQPANKLPLLKNAFRLLVDNLREEDRVAIVVYAGASGLVLPSTSCDEKGKILERIENLEAGGSTNGGQGIELAYRIAEENLVPEGINRVILATDGDFNVGVTNQGDLTRLIEDKAASGIFLTVLGFGMGNFKDSTLEKLADRGNGNYGYIDSLQEAKKILVEQAGGTLITIAKDVKIQVEFNPQEVEAYRLVGYENRLLRNEDFNDDTKDAGEVGAGHTITVLYELVPKGVQTDLPPAVDPLKYQPSTRTGSGQHSGELLTLKLRYKSPQEETSRLMEIPVPTNESDFAGASSDFRFAAAVAGFGMILRDSEFKNELTLDHVVQIADGAKGADREGYRQEFINLVRKARALQDLEQLE